MGVSVASAGEEHVADHCPREGGLDLERPFPGSGSASLRCTLICYEVKVMQEVAELGVHTAIRFDCPTLYLGGHAVPVRLVLGRFQSCVTKLIGCSADVTLC